MRLYCSAHNLSNNPQDSKFGFAQIFTNKDPLQKRLNCSRLKPQNEFLDLRCPDLELDTDYCLYDDHFKPPCRRTMLWVTTDVSSFFEKETQYPDYLGYFAVNSGHCII